MPEVVTAGETMVLAVPTEPGRLRHASLLALKVGGAESNVAIALARLGIQTGWISWLGDDEPGEVVLSRIRAEGVDVSQVRRIRAPTGLYLRERVLGRVRVYYYRQNSAASRMGPGAFDAGYLEGAAFFHTSGVTPALSPSCREFVAWSLEAARTRGVRVSFDVNYRTKLWDTAEARAFIEGLLPKIDLLFLSDEEAEALWGRSDLALLEQLAERGPKEVLLKRGARGSLAWINGDVFEHAAFPVEEADPIGAGDAFVAGYLAGALWGLSPRQQLQVANALGAYSVMSLGDYEGLPSREELWAFLEGKQSLGR